MKVDNWLDDDELQEKIERYDNKYRTNETLTTAFVIFFLVTMFVKFLFF
jgi:hypothetical protein